MCVCDGCLSDTSVCSLFGRLTDLAQRKLTSFYGQEDNETLQNVLHNVPNVVPHLLRLASSSTDNNNAAANVGVTQMFAGAIRSDNSAAQSSSESRARDGSNPATAVAAVSIHPDRDGAYVNPVITDSLNPDSVGDVGACESADSKQQSHVISEEKCKSAKNLDVGGLDHGSGSPQTSPQDVLSSSLSQEDVQDKSTLHNFLRMVSTQSSVIIERLESRNSADDVQSLPEVICLFSVLEYKMSEVSVPMPYLQCHCGSTTKCIV